MPRFFFKLCIAVPGIEPGDSAGPAEGAAGGGPGGRSRGKHSSQVGRWWSWGTEQGQT